MKFCRQTFLFFTVASGFGLAGLTSLQGAVATGGDYLTKVKPLLQERCYACHGALKQKGGLRLDTAASLKKGGDSGPAIDPVHPARSPLLERVTSDNPEEQMPPPHEGERFKPAQVEILRAWIASGAAAPAEEAPEPDPREHWAFRPLVRPEAVRSQSTPGALAPGWARNPVDTFVAQEYAKHGLQPAPEAPRLVLLRRLYHDLVGVPPTLDETLAVENATSEQWYEETVDRLLADPRHGQRWGRHWMDIWRYSDWWGLGAQLRNSQKHMWHWRDWLVESLNADLPYDEMVRLMLAADEIAPADPQKLRATGFLARNWFIFNRNTWMEDTVEHVGKGLLGLTLNCAKCHDHKYDPVSQTDFYRIRAFFEPVHVRLDVVPEEADLERDGLPRVYDGALEVPTYRYVRGEERNPDKSKVIEPGVPAFFSGVDLRIAPVPLPEVAYEPERNPWVLDSHVKQARSSLKTAEETFGKLKPKPQPQAQEAVAKPKAVEDEVLLPEEKPNATARKATVPKAPNAPNASNASKVPKAPEETKGEESREAQEALEYEVARLALELARAELGSVEARAAAMRALWTEAPSEQELRKTAVLAERKAQFAKLEHAAADAELRVLRAAADKKEAAKKQAQTAKTALESALKASDKPVSATETYLPLRGAKWTPTRFLNSGKDDPVAEFPVVSSGRRKALAEWITDARHPLTARVAVNHIWSRHLGTPLVANTFDFGRKSSPPTHPALLDWLASELVAHGWSMKHVHRLIVTSAAYRMASVPASAAVREADPDNLRLTRRAAVRMESELIRDALLALSGELDCSEGGPSIPAAQQAESRRRSLYFWHSNNERNLFLTTFDGAAVRECYRREQSVVPQQALAMSNSKLVNDAAAKIADLLAKRLHGEGRESDEAAFVRTAYLYVLGQKPSDAELEACLQAVREWNQTESGPGAKASVRAHLVWVLLNHNDFVTLR